MYKRQLDAMNYNGSNSLLDFGVLLQTKSIGEATPNEIRESVPFMNGDYDFTGKFAPVSYQSRKITVAFKMKANSENEAFELRTRLVDWLSARDVEMYFDNMPDYIFTGCSCKIKSFKPFNKDTRLATMTVEITADPYIRLKGKYGEVILVEYSSSVNFFAYYPEASNSYQITDLATETNSFETSSSGSWLHTTETLPAVISVVDAYGNKYQEAVYSSDNGEIELPELGEKITADGVYHRYYRFDPAIDGDELIGTGEIRVRGSSGASGLSATLFIGEPISVDKNRDILISDIDGDIATIAPDEVSLISSARLSRNKIKVIQHYGKEVL